MITCLKTSSRGNEALAKKSEMDLILVTSAATSLKSVFENAAPECARPGRSQMNPSSALAKSTPAAVRTLLRPGTGALRPGRPRAKTNFQTRSNGIFEQVLSRIHAVGIGGAQPPRLWFGAPARRTRAHPQTPNGLARLRVQAGREGASCRTRGGCAPQRNGIVPAERCLRGIAIAEH